MSESLFKTCTHLLRVLFGLLKKGKLMQFKVAFFRSAFCAFSFSSRSKQAAAAAATATHSNDGGALQPHSSCRCLACARVVRRRRYAAFVKCGVKSVSLGGRLAQQVAHKVDIRISTADTAIDILDYTR